MPSTLQKSAAALIEDLRFPEREAGETYHAALEAAISRIKSEAVLAEDENSASEAWRAETIFAVQRAFISMFKLLKRGEYYAAWCDLERCEIQLASLLKHFKPFKADEHRLLLLGRMIERWQQIFPYKVFFSPELLKKRIVCGICSARVTPRSHCGHDKGQLYKGEQCHHIVEEVQLLSISIVTDPVQKYSVAFLSGPDGQIDRYNYGNLKFVVDRVRSPFHEWWLERTTMIIAPQAVAHLTAEDPCPCLSGKTFGDCCRGTGPITVPHLQITFSAPPDNSLSENELLF